MPVRLKKRTQRYRGSRTQGWGRVGQHRKSGGRGGTGKAGLHKHKWTWVVKYAPNAFGKHGFLSANKPANLIQTINVGELENLIPESGGRSKPEINVANLGYDKVLGRGTVTRPLLVRAYSFAARAREKIEKAGGEAVSLEAQMTANG